MNKKVNTKSIPCSPHHDFECVTLQGTTATYRCRRKQCGHVEQREVNPRTDRR